MVINVMLDPKSDEKKNLLTLHFYLKSGPSLGSYSLCTTAGVKCNVKLFHHKLNSIFGFKKSVTSYLVKYATIDVVFA